MTAENRTQTLGSRHWQKVPKALRDPTSRARVKERSSSQQVTPAAVNKEEVIDMCVPRAPSGVLDC